MKLDRVIAVRNNKTVYRDGDKCIKVFNENFSKAMVLNEALNQARVEETGLSMPKIHEVTTIDGKWAIVSDYIKGKTLAQIISEEPENAEKWIKFFVEQQLIIHSKTCPMLSKLKDKMNSKISQAELAATVRYDLHTRLEGMPKHNKLCHGDFNTSNVIIAEDGTPFIIDWAHATQGNASADAARSYLCFWLDGDIGGADIYLDLFCSMSGTDMKYVQSWMPIVAASQSVKGNAKEREFLLGWVNVVDQ
ncbi:TIGR02172 family protein [Ruminococcus sp. YE71]|uniref:phosphotransferase n=1 Tax=unclassified Ruminococcus TaxID=2608920 RepID=UPI00087FFDB7|nr:MULTISPECIES: phosphotransferase [unclassified Ruminococcus]SDA22762.1 TIGR02172 family protein [Ruminococcus sp. YE78]SFW38755.1 TIGR02172 family protein [Ruminococcus sp. YE71]